MSYGLTEPLLKFWKRAGYTPVYVRQTQNESPGEYTCIMFKPLPADDLEGGAAPEWLQQFSAGAFLGSSHHRPLRHLPSRFQAPLRLAAQL